MSSPSPDRKEFTKEQVWAVISSDWLENKRPSSVELRRMLFVYLRGTRAEIYGPDFPFPEYRRETLAELRAMHRSHVADYVAFEKKIRPIRERLFMLWLTQSQSERIQ
jgi:hypothetical protein